MRLFLALCCSTVLASAQQLPDLSVGGHTVQFHAFGSQGFMYSNVNNYMTMKTTNGSLALTDFGANVSTKLTDKFRVGAQIYDRNVGELGNWQPTLDWAVADYKFKDWLGFRGGKVKSTLGLFNDSQDAEFLHTWALMPQSVYSLDQRGSMISHYGGDVYGTIGLKKLGDVNYTVWGGEKPQDMTGGFVYALETSRFVAADSAGVPVLSPVTPATVRKINSYGGTAEGADLRWNTPVHGWLAGSSYVIQDSNADGIYPATGKPVIFLSTKDTTTAFYTEYTRGNFRFDGEYRRQLNPARITAATGVLNPALYKDMRMGYVAASYRLTKMFEVGAYHSRFVELWNLLHGDPPNHLFDTTLAVRVDLRNYIDLKVEGHFIDGTMQNTAISRGFYVGVNPTGMNPQTKLLVVRLGFHI